MGGMPFESSGGFPFSGGMPGGGGARTFHFSTGGGGGNGGFSFSNPDDFISSFMGGGLGGGVRRGRTTSSRFADMNGGGRRAPTPEVTVVEKPMPVTLEELYNGTTKKMKVKRKTFDPTSGKQSMEDRILEVPIKKGLKPGSKIKFTNVGDQVEGGTQDLHFVVSEVSFLIFHGFAGIIWMMANLSFYRKITRSSNVKAMT